MNGIFGSTFDFNGDGELGCLEQAAEFALLDMLIEQKGSEDDYDN